MRSFFSIGAFAISLVLPHQSNLTASTHCGTDLCTWWHETGEVKTNSAMAPDAVRQSRQYLVQVAVAGSGKYFDSFVYEAIETAMARL